VGIAAGWLLIEPLNAKKCGVSRDQSITGKARIKILQSAAAPAGAIF
jgi:hypothetical protein